VYMRKSKINSKKLEIVLIKLNQLKVFGSDSIAMIRTICKMFDRQRKHFDINRNL